MALSPSGIVRQGTFNLLKALYNSTLATAVADYSNVKAFAIDFSPPKSTSFFYGRLDDADVSGTSPRKHNFMTLYTIRSVNMNLEKFGRTFAGRVQSGVDVWISSIIGSVQQDFEAMPLCIEKTLYSIFNAQTSAQYWPSQVAFNGNIQVDFGQPVKNDQNWQMRIGASLVHEVSI